MESQIAYLQTDIERLREQVKDQDRKIDRLCDDIRSQGWEIDSLKRTVDQLERQLSNMSRYN